MLTQVQGEEIQMREAEDSCYSERRMRRRRIVLALFVTAIMVATAFTVTASVLHRSRAEMLSEIPLQWQRYVNAAIENGDIDDGASPQEVKDWLAGRMGGMSDKVKQSWVNPFNAKKVAAREAAGGGGGAGGEPEPPAVTGTGQILVLLVEFAGSDTYQGTTYTGPMHNQIPQPSPENNVDYWVSDYSTGHYMDLLFGSDGLTLKNYYEEQSNGLFTVDGYVSAWVQITDHSEWWYGADSRSGGEGSDDQNGPVWRLALDATKAAYAQYGTAIPWADFDTDGDGWIDSLMVVNAGVDQSAGGPSWAVWAHSWFVNWPQGYEIDPVSMPGLKIGPYTTEPENEAVGVYAHEYGHQLGLPDEYDYTYIGEAPTGFLTLMSSGSWGPGPTPDGRMALGVSPSHLEVWAKYVLGWENGAIKHFDYSDLEPVSGTVTLSQVEGSGKIRAIKVELPAQAVPLPLPTPKTGEYQWYSGYKPDVVDVLDSVETSSYMLTMAKPVTIPAGGAVLQFYEWYDIESYYDWAFVEVSADSGVTWTSLPGKYTTNDNPYGGNDGNGITGSSRNYVLEKMDLSAYAGQSILIRFRLQQDSYVYGLGWTLDDITIIEGRKKILFQDTVDLASEELWVKSATDELGPGWSLATATMGGAFRHYYIMEWRNFVGFDRTLSTSYQFVGDYVEFWSHTPGLMIWYRNFAVGDNNVGLHPGRVAIGVVDAHPEPLYWPSGHILRQRLQLMDAAFTMRPTIANTITLEGVVTEFPSLPAQPTFDDSNTFFYSQTYKGVTTYCGLIIPTYGVTATVVWESSDLTSAKVEIDAAPTN
jgi:immune inhibitor A